MSLHLCIGCSTIVTGRTMCAACARAEFTALRLLLSDAMAEDEQMRDGGGHEEWRRIQTELRNSEGRS